MFIKNKQKNNDGYAILFTVVIVGIISMITVGLSNSAYKQTILSSVAKDSTIAFYQADIGTECALYADKGEFFKDGQSETTFNCAEQDLIYFHDSVDTSKYRLDTPNENVSSKCFRIEVTKNTTAEFISSKIISKGYNICKKNNLKTVERGIMITY